jgi:hypothetical protein
MKPKYFLMNGNVEVLGYVYEIKGNKITVFYETKIDIIRGIQLRDNMGTLVDDPEFLEILTDLIFNRQ